MIDMNAEKAMGAQGDQGYAPPRYTGSRRIIAKVDQYARDPASLANQVIIMTGSEYRRMGVGDYRVIFDM